MIHTIPNTGVLIHEDFNHYYKAWRNDLPFRLVLLTALYLLMSYVRSRFTDPSVFILFFTMYSMRLITRNALFFNDNCVKVVLVSTVRSPDWYHVHKSIPPIPYVAITNWNLTESSNNETLLWIRTDDARDFEFHVTLEDKDRVIDIMRRALNGEPISTVITSSGTGINEIPVS